jgi:hypothetical protein
MITKNSSNNGRRRMPKSRMPHTSRSLDTKQYRVNPSFVKRSQGGADGVETTFTLVVQEVETRFVMSKKIFNELIKIKKIKKNRSIKYGKIKWSFILPYRLVNDSHKNKI